LCGENVGLGGHFSPAGTPLSHAKIFVRAEDSRIEIAAKSLGETLSDAGELLPNLDGKFLTNDEGCLDEKGRISVLGRADRYIISGGEKIDPAIVENALRRAGASAVLVVGEPDAEWGERVVALIAGDVPADFSRRVREILPATMFPKKIVRVAALPFDGKGKIDRAALRLALGVPAREK